jgi:predicted PurR-regulated permease PerM
MAGNCLTSLIAGIVVFVTLLILGVPFPFLWGLWVALVDFIPTVGGALAGIPTVLFAAGHSLTAGIVTAVVFAVYTPIETHVLNPLALSTTVRVSPLFALASVLAGASIGGWLAASLASCGPARDPARRGAPKIIRGHGGNRPIVIAVRQRQLTGLPLPAGSARRQ